MATRDISGAILGAIEDTVVYPFFAVQFDFDSQPIRVWTGTGTLVYEGLSYTGTGNLLNVSSIEETSEMAVRGATLTMTGIPSELLSLALQEPYQGRTCTIYFGMFRKGALLTESSVYLLKEDGGKIFLETQETGLTQLFTGYMDEMNIDEGPEFATIEMKVENKLIDLERTRIRRFSSGYQKSVYPNDKGLDFVEALQDKEILWGRKAT
jgi:hypothetical protein